MANVLSFSKVTALPATFEPSTVYLIPNANAGYLDIFVSDSTGSSVNKVVTRQDVTAASVSSFEEFPTHTALSGSTAPTASTLAYVANASDDAGQTPAIVGGAFYVWDTTIATPAWVLVGNVNITSNLTDSSGFLAYKGTIIPTYLATEAW